MDGVNAVSGEDASPSQAGYVLAPWQSTEVGGWRKSLDDIAQFYFTALPDSYAARTGRPDNIGVIGIAAFTEARPVYDEPYGDYAPYPAPRLGRGRAEDKPRAAAPAAESSARSPAADSAYEGNAARQRIGTGHGAREWSPVQRTEFVRASSRPEQLTQLRYDAPARLAALGIIPRPYRRQWPYAQQPQAFPDGFVADPPYRY